MRKTRASVTRRLFGNEDSKPESIFYSTLPAVSTSIYKIDERQHFHYNNVELGPVNICLVTEEAELTTNSNFNVSNFKWKFEVESNCQKWLITKTLEEFTEFDGQLHRCVFDRRFSRLVELRLLGLCQTRPTSSVDPLSKISTFINESSPSPTSSNSSNITTTTAALSWAISNPVKIRCILSQYVERLSQLTGSVIKCFPVLKFLELDSKGNHFVPIEQFHFNIPAVAAAIVIKDFTATNTNELTLKIGDFVSIIEMQNVDQSDNNFWKGKLTISGESLNRSRTSLNVEPTSSNHGNHVFSIGYFPSSHVKLFTGKTEYDGYSPFHFERLQRRSLIDRHRELWKLPASFPFSFRRKKIPKDYTNPLVFGVDLSEHVNRHNYEIPLILTKCTQIIETHGLVTGIYRQCGIQSNIQRLKWEFDTGQLPDLEDPKILRDIHCVASLLKQYFRQLPNSLFTYELHADFLRTYQKPKHRIEEIQKLVRKLPPVHFKTAQALMKHLHKMCQCKHLTDMDANNLAIVWAPNLFRTPPSEDNDGQLLRGISIHNRICNFMILNAEEIFDDAFLDKNSIDTIDKTADPQGTRHNSSEEIIVPKNRICVEVNGGPAVLPSGFHTVIEKNQTKDQKWGSLFRNSSVRHRVTSLLSQKRRNSDFDHMVQNRIELTGSYTNSFATNGIRRCTSVISNLTTNMEAFGSNVARTVRKFSARKFGRRQEKTESLPAADPIETLNVTTNGSVDDIKEEEMNNFKEIAVIKPKKVMFENSGIEEHFFYTTRNSEEDDGDQLSTDISSAESLPLDISRYDNVPTTNTFFT